MKQLKVHCQQVHSAQPQPTATAKHGIVGRKQAINLCPLTHKADSSSAVVLEHTKLLCRFYYLKRKLSRPLSVALNAPQERKCALFN